MGPDDPPLTSTLSPKCTTAVHSDKDPLHTAHPATLATAIIRLQSPCGKFSSSLRECVDSGCEYNGTQQVWTGGNSHSRAGSSRWKDARGEAAHLVGVNKRCEQGQTTPVGRAG